MEAFIQAFADGFADKPTRRRDDERRSTAPESAATAPKRE